jgi:hypothetical protein
VIHDKSAIHGWSLDGPHGFAKDIAKIPSIGTKTVTLTLKAGKYKFYCPNHEAIMFGHFTATCLDARLAKRPGVGPGRFV